MNTNLNKTLIFPAVIIAALSLSSAVFAQNNYFGIGTVASNFERDDVFCEGDFDSLIISAGNSSSYSYTDRCDSDLAGLKIYAAAGISNNLALEFGYVDFGEGRYVQDFFVHDSGKLMSSPRQGQTEFSTIYLAAVGIFPISESWDVSTKLGRHSYDVVYWFQLSQRQRG